MDEITVKPEQVPEQAKGADGERDWMVSIQNSMDGGR
jgi:hypothetical protein